MAGKEGLTVKIDGDASGLENELNKATRSAKSAAAALGHEYAKAGMSLQEGMAKAWQEIKKAQSTGQTVVINGVETIIQENKKLISQKDDLSDIYDETGDSAKHASTKIKAGLADIKAGIDMAAAAARSMYNVASKGVNYNATIEQLKTSFEVMTGSAEKAADVVERLRVMGAETPFEFADLASTTQLLMQYGFAADEAIDRMSMLGDIAQRNKEAMNSIALGYAQMSSAGKVNLQDIKQMINGGFNPLQEISERTGESMASLYDRISKGTMAVDEITQSMVHATSEGGKFYQSMEKQSRTLNGQLATLKDNADMLLGSLTEGMSNGLRDQILPFANNLVAELQTAFDTGGYQGLVDTATDMIPDLLGMMTGSLQDGIAGLTRWLPQGAQKLMSALPDALRAGNAIIPQITQTMFEIAGSVVGDLVAMLPELAPLVGEGVLNLFSAVGLGALDALSGIEAGLSKMLKKIGVIAPTAAEAFAALVEGVDQQTIDALKKTVDVDIDTDITVDDYQSKIDTAVDAIEGALKGIPELTDDERETIKNAIIKGSGIDVVQIAFDEMGVDPSTATATITDAQTAINTVVENLGLSDSAKTRVQGLISNNADAAEIQSALESFGIPSGTASTAASSITTEMDALNSALTDLGVPASVISDLRSGLLNDKQMIISSLQWLGISDADLSTITDSYDAVSGSLTASVDGIYEDIANKFTDGIPESDADVKAAKDAIEGIAIEAKERLDKWYTDKVEELKNSGLSGDTLTTELANAKETYDALNSALDESTNAAITQTEEMVGKSTEYCQSQLEVMRETFDLIEDLTAEIDMLTDADVSAAETSRKLTIEGVTTDTGTQLEAFLITYKEYTDKVRKAEEDYLAAVEEARAAYDNGGSEEDYQAAEADAKEKLANAKQDAANYYQQYVDSILGGIMMADPQMANVLQQAVNGTAISDLVTDLNSALTGAFDSNQRGETTLSLSDILGQFNIDDTGIENLAASLGLTPDVLINQLDAALKSGDTTFGGTAAMFATTIDETIASMLSAEDVDFSGIAGTLATAIDSGYLLPAINGIDYTNAATIFNRTLQTALSVTGETRASAEAAGEEVVDSAETGAKGSKDSGRSKGNDFGSGYVSGVRAWARAAYSAGYTLGNEVAKGTAAAQQSSSPSKVAKRLGGYFGDGYAIGLEESMRQAVSVAKRMTGQISTAADISNITRVVNMPNIQQEIMVANDQTKTPVILNGVKIAEIQGYNNSTQIAWQNTRAAKGVGSR